MTRLPRWVRLEVLRRSLEAAVKVIKALDTTLLMVRAMTEDLERLDFVLSSHRAAMDPPEIGSMAQLFGALVVVALEKT